MPAIDHQEREAKFQVAPDQHPRLFAQAISLDGYTFQAAAILNQTDIYMDTPAFDLLRHGLALRVRRHGEVIEVGIKSIEAARSGAVQSRLDVAFPLPTDAVPLDATTWPRAVKKQLADISVKMKTLRPLVAVHQTRRKSHLQPNTDTPSTRPPSGITNNKWRAEWSMDAVWFDTSFSDAVFDHAVFDHAVIDHDVLSTAESATLPNEQASKRFHELEIELLPPDHEAEATRTAEDAPQVDGESEVLVGKSREDGFDSFVDFVQKHFALTPVFTSKFVRGLESIIAQTHGNVAAITPTMTLAAGGRLLLHQQLLQIMLNEQGVHGSKDPEYVHQMRVAIRRARAAMRLCRGVFTEKELAPHIKGLKQLGRVLGAVRDLDVAVANLRTFSRTQPESQHSGLKLLRKELKIRRRHAQANLFAHLNSKQHRKFIKRFATFCAAPNTVNVEQPASQDAVIPTQVRHTLPSIIVAAYSAVRAYEVAMMGQQIPPLETFHNLRIQAKYLRYLIEFTQHLLGDEGATLAAQLRALQEHLGDLNDAHVEGERLHQWQAQLHDNRELDAAIEIRLAQLNERIHELATTVPFNVFVSSHTRTTLAAAIARL